MPSSVLLTAAKAGTAFKVGANGIIGPLHQSRAGGALIVRAESLAAHTVRALEVGAHSLVGGIHRRREAGALVVRALRLAALERVAHIAALSGTGFYDRGGAIRALDGAAEQRFLLVGWCECDKVGTENVGGGVWGVASTPETRHGWLPP